MKAALKMGARVGFGYEVGWGALQRYSVTVQKRDIHKANKNSYLYIFIYI